MVLLAAPLRGQRIRRRLEQQGAPSKTHAGRWAGAPRHLVCSVVILFSLLIGYIAFARFLTYQLIWVVLVLMTFYFMVLFTTDLCAALFSPQTVSGKMLKKTLSFRIAIWNRCRPSLLHWPNVPCCC